MKLDIEGTFDSVLDQTKEAAEALHVKTNELHEKYVSKVLPDLGKYGEAVAFAAELAPGVSEYNAIKDGDWKAFAVSAGIDVIAAAAGVITAGAGFAAIKGGSTAAKTGVRMAAREIAEAGTKKVVKEAAETGTKKAVKEVTEAGAEKTVKEITEKTDHIVYRHLECINQELEGLRHPKTGVEFVRKTVDNGSGEIVEGVFPKFESKFDVRLKSELFEESNFKQFKEANSQLLERIEASPAFRKNFSAEQLEQIRDGCVTGAPPDGYVWHHNEEAGILQLVDQKIHSQTGHTGGRSIWGGGYEKNRR